MLATISLSLTANVLASYPTFFISVINFSKVCGLINIIHLHQEVDKIFCIDLLGLIKTSVIFSQQLKIQVS